MHFSTLAVPLFGLATHTLAATYSLSDTIVGSGFYSAFDFQDIADPTNGRVQYVNQATAQSNNLTFASDNTFILRADHTTTLAASDSGRKSVRIRSKKTYSTHVAIFDVRHMPQGCATWPAIWETNESNWPNGGEIDILEGVNDKGSDTITLHTGSGCSMPVPGRDQTGNSITTECNAAVNGNAGCGITAPQATSYGPTFNSNGGGIYAMERTNQGIKAWFWPRGTAPPSDITSGSVNTANWGLPVANFVNDSCDFASHFSAHNIIINLTLCGDWAGSVFAQDGCPGACVDYVNNNPGAFANAYFDFASVRVYQ